MYTHRFPQKKIIFKSFLQRLTTSTEISHAICVYHMYVYPTECQSESWYIRRLTMQVTPISSRHYIIIVQLYFYIHISHYFELLNTTKMSIAVLLFVLSSPVTKNWLEYLPSLAIAQNSRFQCMHVYIKGFFTPFRMRNQDFWMPSCWVCVTNIFI